MLNNDSLNQYSWIMKVLESCENDTQVGTTEKLFELYKKMWVKDMTQKHIVTLTANFDKEKKSKLIEILDFIKKTNESETKSVDSVENIPYLISSKYDKLIMNMLNSNSNLDYQ